MLLAALIGVTPRTISTWVRALDDPPKRPGRPGHSPALWRVGYRRVRRELERRNWTGGWREVERSLPRDEELGRVPTRIVQWATAEAKRRHARRRQRRIERNRVSVEVLSPDALWSLDGAQLGRWPGGPSSGAADPSQGHICPREPGVSWTAESPSTKVIGEMVRDVATTRILAASVGGPATGSDVVSLLESAQREHGSVPLVLASDNGPENVNQDVAAWAKRHRVTLLRSEPRTPQHNPWAERMVAEVRADTGLASSTPLEGPWEAAELLEGAMQRLNQVRIRASRGWRTAQECSQEMPRWYTRVSRESFHQAACSAIEKAVQGQRTARARRRAEREAIYATLEHFGLVRRTRGGAPITPVEGEDFS